MSAFWRCPKCKEYFENHYDETCKAHICENDWIKVEIGNQNKPVEPKETKEERAKEEYRKFYQKKMKRKNR